MFPAENEGGGTEARGGRGLHTVETFFECVEGFDGEFAEAVFEGVGNDSAVAVESGGEGGRLLEPGVDGGAVDASAEGGFSDGGSADDLLDDGELDGSEFEG